MEAESKIKAGDYPVPYRPRILKRAFSISLQLCFAFAEERAHRSMTPPNTDNNKRKDEDSKAPQR